VEGSCSNSMFPKLPECNYKHGTYSIYCKHSQYGAGLQSVMGTHSFIRYFITVTVTLLVTAVTNKFLFSSACNEVTEAIGDLKID
jgi:hypothetical protein